MLTVTARVSSYILKLLCCQHFHLCNDSNNNNDNNNDNNGNNGDDNDNNNDCLASFVSVL